MSEFGHNQEFAKFLLLAKTDNAFTQSLQEGSHETIDNFPGLSDTERNTLKVIDWKKTEVHIPNDVLHNFQPNISARVCTEIVGPTFATKRCDW